MLRNPTYTGIGPTFWRSMDMLSSRDRRLGHAELRQGPAGPDRPHRPPGRAGPVPERAGGGAADDRAGPRPARVLDLVRRRARRRPPRPRCVRRPADGAALTRFANSYIHQNVAEPTDRVRLRLHLDGRTASRATTTSTDADGLRALVERTRRGGAPAARRTRSGPGWPPPAALAGDGPVDEATATATPAERAERVRAFVAAAGGLATAGYCRTDARVAAPSRTRAGQAVDRRGRPRRRMDGIARDRRRATGWPGWPASRLADLDGAVLGARAAGQGARRRPTPVELPPGRVRGGAGAGGGRPTCSANLALYGFNGKAFVERAVVRRAGRAAVRPGGDARGRPDQLGGLPFDAEGTPKRARSTWSRRRDHRGDARPAHGGRRPARASTGHAGRRRRALGPGRHPPARCRRRRPPPAPARSPARRPTRRSRPLVAGVERGLLVTDIWYTRVLDPRPLVVTGLTRNGVWLIEDGEVTPAGAATCASPSRTRRRWPRARCSASARHAATQPPHGWACQSYRRRRCGWRPGTSPAAPRADAACTGCRRLARASQSPTPGHPRGWSTRRA